MTRRTPKLFKNIALLSVLTFGIVYASNTSKEENKQINYKNMSTNELQIHVEKLSNEGNLPFEMGVELMNRWTESTKEIN